MIILSWYFNIKYKKGVNFAIFGCIITCSKKIFSLIFYMDYKKKYIKYKTKYLKLKNFNINNQIGSGYLEEDIIKELNKKDNILVKKLE